jgi:hypothetical protein
VERPEGVKIGGCFVAAILIVSFASRVGRSLELRVTELTFDPAAERILDEVGSGPIRIIANEPDSRDRDEYVLKEREERTSSHIPDNDPVIFLEVTRTDPSDFENALHVEGERRHGYQVLKVAAPSVPNGIAATLLAIRDRTNTLPHVYFEWTEGNPLWQLLRYLIFGDGEVAPVTREILRQAEPTRTRRPVVHVA